MPTQQPQAPGTSQPQIDPTALNLSRAIRTVESGDNPNAKGASGEFGIGQWMPGNFESAAKKYGLDPADRSQGNQEHVLYNQIDEQLKAGHSQSEVASWWNSGKYDPTGNVGVNKEGVKYDTPGYVAKVQKAYEQSAQGQSEAPQTQQQQPSPSLLPNPINIGSELANNIAGRLNDLNNAAMLGQQGGLHVGSGLIQGAGAFAGAAGDIVNAGLELIPGVQALEKGLGDAMGSMAQTPEGQAIIQAGTQLAQAHPEIAGDLAAGANVLSVLPMFKGLSLAKGAVSDSFVGAFKGKLQNAAETELRNALPDKIATSVANAEGRGLDPIKMLIADGRNLPDIVARPAGGFEYSAKAPIENFEQSLAGDEQALQAKLSQGISKNVGVSLAGARQRALADVATQYRLSGTYAPAVKATNAYFDSVEASSGGRDIISLNEFNGIKRDVRKDVNFDSLGIQKNNVKFTIGQSLMKQVEKVAAQNGIEGVPEINKVMSAKLEAMKVLDGLDGRRIKTKSGILREGTRDVAGAVGEVAGNAVGVPFAGTFAGRGLANLARGTPSYSIRKLKTLATHTPTSTGVKGLLKASLGVSGQQMTRAQSPQTQ